MNKFASFKHKINTTKKSQKMRVIYKHRNNKQTFYPQHNISKQIHDDQKTIYGELINTQISNKSKRIKTQYQSNNQSRQKDRSRSSLNNKTYQSYKFNQKTRKTFYQASSRKSIVQSNKNNIQPHKNSLQSHKNAQMLKPLQQIYNQHMPQSKQFKPSNIQQIQQIISQLMQKRLCECLSYKNRQDWKLDNQFDKIISFIKSLKQSQQYRKDNKIKQHELNFLEKKIQLIQKLIAQNVIESQIIKKYWGMVAHRKKNIFFNHYKSQKINTLNDQDLNSKQIITSTTANQEHYKSPSKSYYTKLKYNPQFFNSQKIKQPLPRSSYKRDYLICPPQYNFPKKIYDNNFMRSYQSAKVMNTSYKSQFKYKKINNKVNHKQLDAFRNKFKNLPIIFNRKQRPQYDTLDMNRQKQQQSQLIKSKHRTIIEPKEFIKELTTEAKREYSYNREKYSKSMIKHENIDKMKRELKRKYNL